jgi:chemotaxis protein MotB
MSKKHGGGGGHHGGSWKVAYADFVTAMMALFLCLWLTAQDTKIKDAVERAFRNPFSAVNKESTGIIPNQNKDATSSSSSSQKGNFNSASATEMEMLRHITDDLSKLLADVDDAQNSIKMELTPDGLRINVFDRSHKPIFDQDTDIFTPYGAWVFSTLAWEIARYETFKIELEGHTDASLQTGRENRGKWELSSDRANAARRKLIESGVLSSQVFQVSGFADTQPMKGTQPSDEANRRVTVLLRHSDPRMPDRSDQASDQASNANQP